MLTARGGDTKISQTEKLSAIFYIDFSTDFLLVFGSNFFAM